MPALRRMFVPVGDVNRRFRGIPRRSTASTALFGHLVTPGGGRTFPVAYIDALLTDTSGVITDQLVRQFNRSSQAQAAMQKAEAEFTQRLTDRAAQGPRVGLLTLNDVAWLLGVSRSAVDNPRRENKLPAKMLDGVYCVKPSDLTGRCTWRLPVQ